MWNTRARRWLGIPAVFLLAGPPTGGATLTLAMTPLFGPGLVLGLPVALVMAYPFGAVQAGLTGLVAAATLPPGGDVRARPVLLAGGALGLLAGALSAVAQEAGVTSPSRAEVVVSAVFNGLLMLAVHLAGAVAGLLACRWLERRRGGGDAPRRDVAP